MSEADFQVYKEKLAHERRKGNRKLMLVAIGLVLVFGALVVFALRN